jgi:hypothetical protein
MDLNLRPKPEDPKSEDDDTETMDSQPTAKAMHRKPCSD